MPAQVPKEEGSHLLDALPFAIEQEILRMFGLAGYPSVRVEQLVRGVYRCLEILHVRNPASALGRKTGTQGKDPGDTV